MIALVGASALLLALLQAGVTAPRNAFNDCLTQTAAKATSEKVAADAYEAYLQSACAAQIGAFKSASIAFDVKNKIGRKQAAEDADAVVADFVDGAVRNYKRRAPAAAK